MGEGFKETQDEIEAVGDTITGDFSAFEDNVTDSFDTELASMYDICLQILRHRT